MSIDAVDQDELILQDEEQRKLAAFYQVPVRYLFNGPHDEWLLREMARLVGIV